MSEWSQKKYRGAWKKWKMTKGVSRLPHNFAYVRNMPVKIHHTVHTSTSTHYMVLNSSRWDQPSSTVSDAISSGLYIFCLLAYMEEKNGILLPKLFWPNVRKNCSSGRKKLLKFEAEGWLAKNLQKFLRSLEQWKVRTIFGNRILF